MPRRVAGMDPFEAFQDTETDEGALEGEGVQASPTQVTVQHAEFSDEPAELSAAELTKLQRTLQKAERDNRNKPSGRKLKAIEDAKGRLMQAQATQKALEEQKALEVLPAQDSKDEKDYRDEEHLDLMDPRELFGEPQPQGVHHLPRIIHGPCIMHAVI